MFLSLASKSLFNRAWSRLKLQKGFLFMCRRPDASVNHRTVCTEKGQGDTVLYSSIPKPVPVEGRCSVRDSVDFANLLARTGLRCTVSLASSFFFIGLGHRTLGNQQVSYTQARRGRWSMKFWRIVRLCRPATANYITGAKTRHGYFQLLYMTSQFVTTS